MKKIISCSPNLHTPVLNPTDFCMDFTKSICVIQHLLKFTRKDYLYIHKQTYIFPHCFDCILSTICLFNQHSLRTYACFTVHVSFRLLPACLWVFFTSCLMSAKKPTDSSAKRWVLALNHGLDFKKHSNKSNWLLSEAANTQYVLGYQDGLVVVKINTLLDVIQVWTWACAWGKAIRVDWQPAFSFIPLLLSVTRPDWRLSFYFSHFLSLSVAALFLLPSHAAHNHCARYLPVVSWISNLNPSHSNVTCNSHENSRY